MSKYSEKLLAGIAPTDQDWVEHLQEAHRIAPSMTPHAFASYRTSDGLNSYDVLARSLSSLRVADPVVVDLACGDGFLLHSLLTKLSAASCVVGIDMSDRELEIARASFTDPRVSFENAQAQAIPVPDKSADAILCHMAFMLMLPVEPVVSEIARVLKPGGIFSAVIGGPRGGGKGHWGEIQKAMSDFMISRHPTLKEARSGDPRIQTEAGIAELFRRDLGFSRVEAFEGIELDVRVDAAELWDFVKDTYWVGMLPVGEKAELRELLDAVVAKNADPTGKVRFAYPMRKFTCWMGN